MKTLKTAVIQLRATGNKAENIQRAVFLVQQAIRRQAEFILLPEIFVFRGRWEGIDIEEIAEEIPGESIAPLMSLARRHKVFILAGSIFEKSNAAKKVYNTSVLINDRGDIAAKYRKRHLFDANIGGKWIRESDQFVAGAKPAMARIKGFEVGLSICFDLRFPELYREYAFGGAQVLCVPSAFTHQTGKAHWEILLRARAVENLCYVLAPNQAGKNSRGIRCYGHSMIVDPWGKILARASADQEEVIFANLDRKTLKRRRSSLSVK